MNLMIEYLDKFFIYLIYYITILLYLSWEDFYYISLINKSKIWNGILKKLTYIKYISCNRKIKFN